jgi:hypothetical protein
MGWPIDDLTTEHLDQDTDALTQARVELFNAVNKLKELLGEVPDGATLWHSGNSGDIALKSTANTFTQDQTVNSTFACANLQAIAHALYNLGTDPVRFQHLFLSGNVNTVGLFLGTGTGVNEISSDPSMADTSENAICTEAAISGAVLGVNDTWTAVTRAFDDETLNATSSPKMVKYIVNVLVGANVVLQVKEPAGAWLTIEQHSGADPSNTVSLSAIVPAGHSVRVTKTGGGTLISASELS